jgi:hypothetical protein
MYTLVGSYLNGALSLIIVNFLISTIGLGVIYFGPAEAHETQQFGNITLNVGWEIEPPLVGELNNIVIEVQENQSGKPEPVLNALGNIDSSLSFGTLSEPIEFEPSQDAGAFQSKVIPTRIGPYVVNLQGDIKGENISSRFQIEDVESKQSISFPDKTDLGEENNLDSNIQSILSQLANQVYETDSKINLMENKVDSVEVNFQESQSRSEFNYFIAFVALGTGIGGMLMAGYFIYRKTKG